jgi:hypothetical protein
VEQQSVDDAFEIPAARRAYPIPDLIELLGFRRASGKIEVTTANDSFGIYVENGKIRAATSSLRTLRLGHLLLQRGAVEPVFLHGVLKGRRRLPSGRALGAALIDEGAVSRSNLVATVEEQIIEVLSRLVAITNATVMMIADSPLPEGMEDGDFDTDALLAEANNRHAQRAAIHAMQRLLPAHNAELALTVQLALVSYQLSDSELLIALQIDKNAITLDGLSSIVPLDPLTLKRAIISLFERGYLSSRGN